MYYAQVPNLPENGAGTEENISHDFANLNQEKEQPKKIYRCKSIPKLRQTKKLQATMITYHYAHVDKLGPRYWSENRGNT